MRCIPILWLVLLTALAGSVQAETYRLSMLPRFAPDEINRRITPLAETLSQLTGHRIEVVLVNDFSQYEKRLKSGDIHIGYENPYIYTRVSEVHEAIAMAVKGRDKDRFRGIVITRKDSGLTSLEDLRRKTVSIVGYTSAGGFLSQKLSLMNAGIDTATDMTIVEAVDNKQENVILGVYLGETDAGFIRESALHQADPYIASLEVAVISQCAWLPNWAFSVNRNLPAKVKLDIQSALLGLNATHKALTALKVNSFRFAGDTDYDPVRLAAGMK